MTIRPALAVPLVSLGLIALNPLSAEICTRFGPQTPRDISNSAGSNEVTFRFAPPVGRMNLCNIHFHKNAEHKGPGFSTFAGPGTFGGFQCNPTSGLDAGVLDPPTENHCTNVSAGDTIEVHWVYSSCDVAPGPDLDACSSPACANPQLRVEAQVFFLVNDPNATSFMSFAYRGNRVRGLHQARSLPNGTGRPVTFLGSTTGPDFTEETCSPLQVSWSVRPQCANLDIASLSRWCERNVFRERRAHGVRPLVTSPELLSEIHHRH